MIKYSNVRFSTFLFFNILTIIILYECKRLRNRTTLFNNKRNTNEILCHTIIALFE